MKTIANEKAYAIKCIEDGHIDRKPTKTLIVLVKYYHSLGMNKEEILDELMDFMNDNYAEFVKAKWREILVSLVDRYANKEHKLNNIESVTITQNEMDTIDSVGNPTLEKILFVMLVYCKVQNQVKGDESDWITSESKDIFSDAKLSRSNKDKESIINKLYNMGLIQIPRKVGSLAMKLEYVDRDSEPVINITSFSDFIIDYHIYKGDKVKKCSECEKRILVKSNRTQYCRECASLVKSKQTVESNSKKRLELSK